MQNFTYHAHTNGQGIFDGRNTAEEMICRAEKLGFEELGISNHLIFHPNLKTVDKMFFNDFDVVSSVMQKNAEEIRRAADRAKIKVLVGFEVDFFPSSAWRLAFEKLQKTLRADYYIGSCHFLRNKEETKLVNMYLYREGDADFLPSELGTGLEIYWQNVALAAESGYFNFLAHLDVYKIFPYLQNLPEPESQSLAIDTVCRLKHPYELNTSGWRKCGEQHPALSFLQKFALAGVPVVISDDAHCTEHLAAGFEEAENLLASIDYNKRWRLIK